MAKVFVSYAKLDYIDEKGYVREGCAVQKIIDALSQEGISYWIDREKLEAGDTYAERISRNIKDCDTFLFLSSRRANASQWTLREISTAVSFGKRIIPVRLDHSEYGEAVSLYLSSIQYVDYLELGEKAALDAIISKIKYPSMDTTSIEYGKLPLLTRLVLYLALVVLGLAFAVETYLFLWASTLESTEAIGGLVGLVGEFGILLSVYYVLRLLRRRRSFFLLPLLLVGMMLGASLLSRRIVLMVCTGLLLGGWLGILVACFFRSRKRKSFFSQMSGETVLLKVNDPENFILVYLAAKSVMVFVGHFVSPYVDLGLLFERMSSYF